MGDFKNVYGEEIELTQEQRACTDYCGDKTLLVKGAAGAGKSIVVQCKAKQYIDQYAGEKGNKVLILTFNKTLVYATKQILKINGAVEDYITVNTISQHLFDICKELGLKRDRICDNEQQKRFIRAALTMHRNHYGEHRLHQKPVEFWIDEIAWMKDMNITIKDEDAYYALSRAGRGSSTRMSTEDRKVAFQIFYCYKAVLTLNRKADWIDCALYIIRHPELVPDKFKYDHVLIDEAQDFSLAQMMAAMMLYKKDMIVALDVNQRLYKKRWTTKMLGISATTKKLTMSMRTSMQIDNFAESIRSFNDDYLDPEDDNSERIVPKRTGPMPEVIVLSNDAEEKAYVIEKVKAWLSESDRVSIGILAATNKQVDLFASWMTDAGIPKEIIRKDSEFDVSKAGVKIATTHSAKGLEFLRVIIPEFIEGYYPYRYRDSSDEDREAFFIRERNRAYVAMTRARHSLIVTFVKNRESQFLQEVSEKSYILKDFTAAM